MLQARPETYKGKMTLVRSLQVYQRIETRIATRLGVSDIWQRNETRFRTGRRAHRWVRGSPCLPTLRHLRLRVEVFDSCWRWKLFEVTVLIWSMLSSPWEYSRSHEFVTETVSSLLVVINAFSFQFLFTRFFDFGEDASMLASSVSLELTDEHDSQSEI